MEARPVFDPEAPLPATTSNPLISSSHYSICCCHTNCPIPRNWRVLHNHGRPATNLSLSCSKVAKRLTRKRGDLTRGRRGCRGRTDQDAKKPEIDRSCSRELLLPKFISPGSPGRLATLFPRDAGKENRCRPGRRLCTQYPVFRPAHSALLLTGARSGLRRCRQVPISRG